MCNNVCNLLHVMWITNVSEEYQYTLAISKQIAYTQMDNIVSIH